MAEAVEFGPYSSAQKYVQTLPASVPVKDQLRIAAYAVYREMYWSHVGPLKIMNRGLDSADDPVYVPSARVVIDTMARYVGAKLTYGIDVQTGTPEARILAEQTFQTLFARERFAAKYAANKHSGLAVGDWCWHIVADPAKPAGTTLSILKVEPDSYFTTYEDELTEDGSGDPDKLMQVRLVDTVKIGDDTFARVQLYDKWHEGTPSEVIESSLTLWKPEDWFDPTKSPEQVLVPPALLPAVITAFPVYHVSNGQEGQGGTFGSSEIRGLEGLQAALNQSVTDEDLALALMGLGVYATDSAGSPTDGQGNQVDWFIYPGAVLENAKGLRRVEGLSTVQPYTDHVSRLEGYLADATGATDAARGRLEVAEAESGIALTIKLAPTLAKAEDKDQIIVDVHNQMFFDLVQMWLPTYDHINVMDVRVFAVLGDKLPVNRQSEADLVSGLVLNHIMSAGSARNYLVTKGFTGMFDPQEGELVLAEMVAEAAALQSDPAVDRTDAELGNNDAANPANAGGTGEAA